MVNQSYVSYFWKKKENSDIYYMMLKFKVIWDKLTPENESYIISLKGPDKYLIPSYKTDLWQNVISDNCYVNIAESII